MRVSTRLAAAALAALALLTLTACTDDADLLSPKDASALIKPPRPPIFIPPSVLATILDINSGADHVCSLTWGGTVSCWGSDTYGQIGTAATDICGEYGYGLQPCVPKPAVITGSATVNGVTQTFNAVSRVTTGSHHTCVLATGTPWCWGNNMNGQIGNGTTSATGTGIPTPTPIGGGPYTSLSAGASATCGITSSTLLFCWGTVGMGTASATTPTLVSWQSGWSADLNVGSMDACARQSTSGWACWGSNWWGQIGVNPAYWQYFEGPLGNSIFAGATNVVSTNGTTCFDAPDGTIKCLGLNDYGQLGDPSFTGSSTYAVHTVGGAAALQLSHVAMGQFHACGLDAMGKAFCWGYDGYGELGRGTANGSVLRDPAPVVGGLTFSKLVAGSYHTCGLTTDARVFCWGSNYSGQLGFPNKTHLSANPAPVQVTF